MRARARARSRPACVSRSRARARAATSLPAVRHHLAERRKAALELLLRYDPDGDHKVLVDLPPAYVEDVARLKADKAELATVVDALLGRLLAPAAGPAPDLAAAAPPSPPSAPRAALAAKSASAAALTTPSRASGAGDDHLLLHALLPPGSLDTLMKHADALPQSSPLLDRLLRQRAPAGGSPITGEDAAAWIVSAVTEHGDDGLRQRRSAAKTLDVDA